MATPSSPAPAMDKKPARSRSFSLRRSFDGQRLRRAHGKTISNPIPQEPVPSIPARHVRTATAPVVPESNATTSSTTCSWDLGETNIAAKDETKAPQQAHDISKVAKPPTRRRSMRDLLRAAVSPRAGRRSTLPPQNNRDETEPSQINHERSADVAPTTASPLPPLSPPAAFKPLGAHPPPPRLATLQEEPRSTVHTLSAMELSRIFDGAPEFSISNAAICDHSYALVTYPSVDGEMPEKERDVKDFEHESFALATAETTYGILDARRLQGTDGVEPGTIGLEHFLQLPLVDPEPTAIDCSRARLLLRDDPEQLGLRAPSMERVIDRLAELGDMRSQQVSDSAVHVGEQRAAEMYTDLFATLLVPPRYSAASGHDPTGLDVQIASLVEVLGHAGLWYDMGRSSERAQLGGRIWAADGQGPDSEAAVDRDILLLQITLAAELLTRIEACGYEKANLQNLTSNIAWNLVLADRFLRGASIRANTIGRPNGFKPANRSSVFSVLTFVTAREDFEEEVIQPVVFPRRESIQFEGLLAFARAMDWPHVDELDRRFHDRHEAASKRLSTAQPSTPLFNPRESDGYLGVLIRSDGVRNSVHSGRLGLPGNGNAFYAEAQGPATRSWMAGLVMPGDMTSQLLMSCLLELSGNELLKPGLRLERLRDGFFYRGKSYWSKSCVVGRVLAASEGAHDMMSWISISSVATPDHNEGWLGVYSTPISSSPKPRLASPELVARDSALLPDVGGAPVHEADLVWPTDNDLAPGNSVKHYKVFLKPSEADAQLSTAVLTFTTPSQLPLSLALTYESQFTSSQPCFPRRQAPHNRHASASKIDKELPAPPCHPLHVSRSYRVVPVTTLLAAQEAQDPLIVEMSAIHPSAGARRDSGAGRGARSPVLSSSQVNADAMLVLDCRGASALQVLGRAWCAATGLHAVVGRERRTCIGCCVREARALDVRVVLRV